MYAASDLSIILAISWLCQETVDEPKDLWVHSFLRKTHLLNWTNNH
jgi:hypothetical protein